MHRSYGMHTTDTGAIDNGNVDISIAYWGVHACHESPFTRNANIHHPLISIQETRGNQISSTWSHLCKVHLAMYLKSDTYIYNWKMHSRRGKFTDFIIFSRAVNTLYFTGKHHRIFRFAKSQQENTTDYHCFF